MKTTTVYVSVALGELSTDDLDLGPAELKRYVQRATECLQETFPGAKICVVVLEEGGHIACKGDYEPYSEEEAQACQAVYNTLEEAYHLWGEDLSNR